MAFNFTPIKQRTEKLNTGFSDFGSNVVASNKAFDAQLTPPTPATPAPTPTTPKDSSTTPVGDMYSSFTAPTDTVTNTKTQDQFLNDYNVDENKIRQDVLSRYQDEINSVKNVYGQLLQEQQKLGVGRLGEDTARQARGGLLGSDFGASQTEGTRKYNLQQENYVLQQQAAAIASVMDRANQEASNEIAAKRLAKSEGLTAYQNYLDTQKERKTTSLNRLAKLMLIQNVSPDQLSPDQLKTLAKQYGTTTEDILNSYLEEKNAQGTTTTEYKTLGKDSVLYDPKTGEIITPSGGTGEGPSAYSQERAQRTVDSATALLQDAINNPGIFGRSADAPIPGWLRTDAYRNFTADLDTLKSNIAFNELTAMREASKTGGALGQVSDREGKLLESALGALSLSQSPENIQKNLQKIIDSINRWNEAVSQYGGSTSIGDSSFAEEW